MKRIHAFGVAALTVLMLLPAAGEAGSAKDRRCLPPQRRSSL